jgi:CubicO group peptidase (beta-lactamase class C family)
MPAALLKEAPMSTQETQIDAAIQAFVTTSQAVGLAVAISQQGELVFSRGYGVQDRDSMRPATPETLFHLASVVKTMTSTAVMQLREAGKLDLDDPIVSHLPYFRVDDPRSDQITIRQCLTHTSGIEHPTDWGWDRPEFDDAALERHVRGLAARKLVDIPPGRTSYSDNAYDVLGAVIAQVSGVSYEEYLRRHILAPLGMGKTTTMPPREGDPALLAVGYERDDAGAIRRSLYPYNRMHVPCGCVASNALEMTRYALAHLNRGQLEGSRILAPESYGALWDVQLRDERDDVNADIALAWWVRRGSPEPIVEHYGWDDGFRSHLCLWPERRQSVVVLCNSDWVDPGEVTKLVAALLAGGR